MAKKKVTAKRKSRLRKGVKVVLTTGEALRSVHTFLEKGKEGTYRGRIKSGGHVIEFPPPFEGHDANGLSKRKDGGFFFRRDEFKVATR